MNQGGVLCYSSRVEEMTLGAQKKRGQRGDRERERSPRNGMNAVRLISAKQCLEMPIENEETQSKLA